MEVAAGKFDNFLTVKIFIVQEFELSIIVNFGCFCIDTQSSEKEGSADKDLSLCVKEGCVTACRNDLLTDSFHSFGWEWK